VVAQRGGAHVAVVRRGRISTSGRTTWWGTCGGGAMWQNIDIIENIC